MHRKPIIFTSIFVLIIFYNFAYGQGSFPERLSDAALDLTAHKVQYDPSYVTIPYPMGDVDANKGVCSDVIIRAYRKLDIDLQKEVHEDMLSHFSSYPQKWGLSKPDPNIDHRRVPNLMRFFERYGETKAITTKASDYKPGDIVCWDLGGGITHIGIVVNKKTSDGKRYMVVHNVGAGQVLEDFLFEYPITGHYKFDISLSGLN